MYGVLCVLLSTASSLEFPPEHLVPFIPNSEDADVGEWPHQVASSGMFSLLKCNFSFTKMTLLFHKCN